MTIRLRRATKDRQLRELSLREAFDSQFPRPDGFSRALELGKGL